MFDCVCYCGVSLGFVRFWLICCFCWAVFGLVCLCWFLFGCAWFCFDCVWLCLCCVVVFGLVVFDYVLMFVWFRCVVVGLFWCGLVYFALVWFCWVLFCLFGLVLLCLFCLFCLFIGLVCLHCVRLFVCLFWLRFVAPRFIRFGHFRFVWFGCGVARFGLVCCVRCVCVVLCVFVLCCVCKNVCVCVCVCFVCLVASLFVPHRSV